MKTITVITTTFNRAYCLHQVYESLTRQTSRDFMWMIVDDGSTDDTKKLIDKWVEEGTIEIEYYYKENGGMHTARNLAYKMVKTELCVIVDSDDWLVDDAIDSIISCWINNKTDGLYGVIAYNINDKGEIVGSCFPEDLEQSKLIVLDTVYNLKGDKKIVLKSEYAKMFPFPELNREKFYPASYKYYNLDQFKNLYLLRKPICVVNYTEDSMTFNKYAQYISCPQSFAHYRNEILKLDLPLLYSIKESIHYIAESKIANNRHYIVESSKPLYIIMVLPAGLLYYYILMHTSRKY